MLGNFGPFADMLKSPTFPPHFSEKPHVFGNEFNNHCKLFYTESKYKLRLCDKIIKFE